MNLDIIFKDGNKFEYYDDDSYHYSGCPTCDFGSEYINEITIKTTNYKINIEFNQMYSFAFTTADAIKIFAIGIKEMTEKEFVDYIISTIKELDSVQYIKVNGKEIDL